MQKPVKLAMSTGTKASPITEREKQEASLGSKVGLERLEEDT